MARLQDLHPDQQAVLQLVLRRGMAYASIADVLGLTPEQVRERALDAVDGLAPDDIDGLALEDRDRIADHLLDQETPDERQATAAWIAGHEPARSWAGLVMAEIAPLRAVSAVPGRAPVPAATASFAAGSAATSASGTATAEPATAAPTDANPNAGTNAAGVAEGVDGQADGNDIRQAFAALGRNREDRPPLDPRKLTVGAVGVVGLIIVVVVVALWVGGVFDGGDDSDSKASTPPATTTTATTTADAAGAAAVVAALPAQINFERPKTATAPYEKAAGVGVPNAVEGVPGIVFKGEGFPPMTKTRLYAVWIDGGGKKPVRLGWFSDGANNTEKTIAADGKIKQSFFPLATATSGSTSYSVINPAGYTRIRVTRETSDRATPGPTVVSGPLQKK